MDITEQIFGIIANAGTARSLAYDAIEKSNENNFKEAEELLKQSEEEFLKAHHIQTDLIQAEARGEKNEISILLIHSQDHLMTAQAEKSLAEQIVKLNKRVYALENK